MVKRIPILLLFVLLMMPLALAEVRLDIVKGYVNNERVSDIDDTGGSFEVMEGDNIDLVITIDNAFNFTIQAKLRGTLQDIDAGDDIMKDQDYYNIGAEDDRTKTLSFNIPNGVNIDDYRLDLDVTWKRPNGTVTEIDRVRYDVIIRKDSDEVTQEAILSAALNNLTASCNGIAKSTSTCFGYIGRANNCSSEMSGVKEERGTYKQQAEDRQSSVDSLKAEKATLQNEKDSLQSQLNGMVSKATCEAQKRTINATAMSAAREEASSSNTKLLGWAVAIGGVAWYLLVYRKKKKTVEGAYFNPEL